MQEYFERAEYLKKTVLTKQDEPVNTGSGSTQKEKKKYFYFYIRIQWYRDDKGEDKEEEKLEAALNSAIVKEKPNVKWSDVAGLE